MKKFQRTIENFICENCGASVIGNGYTNHCPKCLWSKHVDINPGDRLNSCDGMMKPINAFFKNQQWHLTHQCQKCHREKNIKLSDQEISQEKLAQLIQENLK